jgi:hypothetical protein
MRNAVGVRGKSFVRAPAGGPHLRERSFDVKGESDGLRSSEIMAKELQRCAWLCAALAIFVGCYQITFEAIAGEHPVKNFKVTRRDGEVSEVFVKVNEGVRLQSLVDLSYFEGVPFRTSLEEATKKFGSPRSTRTDEIMKVPVSLYAIPKGELGFMTIPSEGGPEHQVWAYPINKETAGIILNESLRAQLSKILPLEGPVRVNILRDVGFGGVTLNMTKDRVDSLILGKRDGE